MFFLLNLKKKKKKKMTVIRCGIDFSCISKRTPAMSEVVKGLQVGLRWLEASDRSTAVEVTHLRNILHRAKAEARESCRQTMLTDFFFRN